MYERRGSWDSRQAQGYKGKERRKRRSCPDASTAANRQTLRHWRPESVLVQACILHSCSFTPVSLTHQKSLVFVWKGQEGTGDPGVQNDPAFTPVHVLVLVEVGPVFERFLDCTGPSISGLSCLLGIFGG